MSNHKKILRSILTTMLYLWTALLVYSIVSVPLGKHNIILALVITVGFVFLGTNKKK